MASFMNAITDMRTVEGNEGAGLSFRNRFMTSDGSTVLPEGAKIVEEVAWLFLVR